MNAVRAAAADLLAMLGAAALYLRQPSETWDGRPFGAIAPSQWRHCPRCDRAGYVLAPGGHIPPCPCTTTGDRT